MIPDCGDIPILRNRMNVEKWHLARYRNRRAVLPGLDNGYA